MFGIIIVFIIDLIIAIISIITIVIIGILVSAFCRRFDRSSSVRERRAARSERGAIRVLCASWRVRACDLVVLLSLKFHFRQQRSCMSVK